MTRPELTNIRDLTFSGWIRKNLPDSETGFLATDMDFILTNYKTKKIMLIEVKTRGADLKEWQKIVFKRIHNWIKKGIDADWTYLGFKVVQFENTNFEDGRCYLNYLEITEEELIKKLSF